MCTAPSCSAQVGAENVSARGRIRLSLRPLLPTMPIVGAVRIGLWEMPDFHFEVTALGGQVALLPMLKTWLYDTVKSAVFTPYLAPGGFSMPLADVRTQTGSCSGYGDCPRYICMHPGCVCARGVQWRGVDRGGRGAACAQNGPLAAVVPLYRVCGGFHVPHQILRVLRANNTGCFWNMHSGEPPGCCPQPSPPCGKKRLSYRCSSLMCSSCTVFCGTMTIYFQTTKLGRTSHWLSLLLRCNNESQGHAAAG